MPSRCTNVEVPVFGQNPFLPIQISSSNFELGCIMTHGSEEDPQKSQGYSILLIDWYFRTKISFHVPNKFYYTCFDNAKRIEKKCNLLTFMSIGH